LLEILVTKSKVCNLIEMLSMQFNVEFALGVKMILAVKWTVFEEESYYYIKVV